eukprot:32190-Eustigmatos_ZCMA.PRE.1
MAQENGEGTLTVDSAFQRPVDEQLSESDNDVHEAMVADQWSVDDEDSPMTDSYVDEHRAGDGDGASAYVSCNGAVD